MCLFPSLSLVAASRLLLRPLLSFCSQAIVNLSVRESSLRYSVGSVGMAAEDLADRFAVLGLARTPPPSPAQTRHSSHLRGRGVRPPATSAGHFLSTPPTASNDNSAGRRAHRCQRRRFVSSAVCFPRFPPRVRVLALRCSCHCFPAGKPRTPAAAHLPKTRRRPRSRCRCRLACRGHHLGTTRRHHPVAAHDEACIASHRRGKAGLHTPYHRCASTISCYSM
jgi:hypothetical protein